MPRTGPLHTPAEASRRAANIATRLQDLQLNPRDPAVARRSLYSPDGLAKLLNENNASRPTARHRRGLCDLLQIPSYAWLLKPAAEFLDQCRHWDLQRQAQAAPAPSPPIDEPQVDLRLFDSFAATNDLDPPGAPRHTCARCHDVVDDDHICITRNHETICNRCYAKTRADAILPWRQVLTNALKHPEVTLGAYHAFVFAIAHEQGAI